MVGCNVRVPNGALHRVLFCWGDKGYAAKKYSVSSAHAASSDLFIDEFAKTLTLLQSQGGITFEGYHQKLMNQGIFL